MKKILSLLFILLLFTSCEKGVEKPKEDTPEVNEVEVVEPIKPEVTEPEVTLPEEIVLPEADENTITITIDFPEDFPETPYTEPDLVSPEEFEWGEYVPFVRYSSQEYRLYMEFYDYAVLTSNCKETIDGNKLYHALNDKYLIETHKIDAKYCEENEKSVYNDRKYIDFLFRSRVIYVSEEADKIGRIRFVHEGFTDSEYLAYHDWTGYYEILDEEKNIYNITQKKTSPSDSMGYIDTYSHNYINLPGKFDNLFQAYNILYADEKTCVYTKGEHEKIYIYSFENNHIDYVLTVPRAIIYDADEYIFDLEQCINSRYLLFDVSHTKFDSDTVNSYFSSYLYDINEQSLTLLETYAFSPSLSPDLNYLAYTDNLGGNVGYDMEPFMKSGFYIKNLKNGTVCFFENNTKSTYGIISWVNEKKLLELIND